MKKLLASLLLTLSLAAPAYAQTNLSQGGTGWATSTFGDLLVGTTSKIRYTRLPIGSTGQVLWVLGGQPAWVSTSSLGITGSGGSGNSAWTIGNGLIYNATTSDNVGVGTTTPTQRLNVFGNLLVSTSSTPLLFVNTAISKVGIGVNNNTGGDMLRVSGSIKSDTSVNATNGFFNTLSALSGNKVTLSGDFYLTGGFFDSTNASGTAGQVLQSTGTSTLWVATSSLGISGGTTYTGTYPIIVTGSVISTGFSTSTINNFTAQNYFNATSTLFSLVTSLVRASSSAGIIFRSNNGTQIADFGAGGGSNATFYGGVNVTGNFTADTNLIYADASSERVGIGTTTPTSLLSVASSTASGTSGLFSIGTSSEIFTVLANGNVGVGTTGPQALLHLSGRSSPLLTLERIGAGNINSNIFLKNQVSSVYAGLLPISGGGFAIGQNADLGMSPQFVVSGTTGNVGIGTSTPLARLHVSTSQSPLSSVSSNADEMILESNGPTGMTITSGTSSDGSIFFADGDSATVGRVVYGHASNTLSLWTNAVQRMTIDSSGSIGIGTTIPATRFHVLGGSRFDGPASFFGTTSPSNFAMEHQFGTYRGIANVHRLRMGGSTPNAFAVSYFDGAPSMWLASNGNAGFGTSTAPSRLHVMNSGTQNAFTIASSSESNLFTISASGNVGIGTSTPTTALHVLFNESDILTLERSGVGRGVIGLASLSGVADLFLEPKTNNSGTALRYRTSDGITNTALFVNPSGNVGIGAASASRTLTVSGSLGLTGAFSDSTNASGTLGQLLWSTGTSTLWVSTSSLGITAGVVSRVVGYSSAASTTINLNTTDVATTTINQPTTFVNPTGTAYDGQMFEIRARATTTQTIYWGTNFASSTDLVNVASVASGTTRFLFEYRQDVQKWELVGKLGGYIN